MTRPINTLDFMTYVKQQLEANLMTHEFNQEFYNTELNSLATALAQAIKNKQVQSGVETIATDLLLLILMPEDISIRGDLLKHLGTEVNTLVDNSPADYFLIPKPTSDIPEDSSLMKNCLNEINKILIQLRNKSSFKDNRYISINIPSLASLLYDYLRLLNMQLKTTGYSSSVSAASAASKEVGIRVADETLQQVTEAVSTINNDHVNYKKMLVKMIESYIQKGRQLTAASPTGKMTKGARHPTAAAAAAEPMAGPTAAQASSSIPGWQADDTRSDESHFSNVSLSPGSGKRRASLFQPPGAAPKTHKSAANPAQEPLLGRNADDGITPADDNDNKGFCGENCSIM
jgi:hypothetical protein